MKIILNIILFFAYTLVSCNVGNDSMNEWENFKDTHKRNFETEAEEAYRVKVFMENKDYVDEHNAKHDRGEVSYRVGLNKYADWSRSEVDNTLNGFNKVNRLRAELGETPLLPALGAKRFVFRHRHIKVPHYLNWRERGSVNPVRDQRKCGSCYAFSALGALEGQLYLKYNKLPLLSVQNIIDCSLSAGNDGCNGGLPSHTFNFLKESKGVNKEVDYPYVAKNGKCRFKPKKRLGKIKDYAVVEPGNEEALKQALVTVGPISVAVDARLTSFQLYLRGVYNDPKCSSSNLTHAVLLVGYGTDHEVKKDYWLIKNSWGKDWGENGYIKIERNAGNMCGVATLATYPLL